MRVSCAYPRSLKKGILPEESSVLRRVFETLKPIPPNLESLVLTTPGACREDGGNRGKTTTLNRHVAAAAAARLASLAAFFCARRSFSSRIRRLRSRFASLARRRSSASNSAWRSSCPVGRYRRDGASDDASDASASRRSFAGAAAGASSGFARFPDWRRRRRRCRRGGGRQRFRRRRKRRRDRPRRCRGHGKHRTRVDAAPRRWWHCRPRR